MTKAPSQKNDAAIASTIMAFNEVKASPVHARR